MSWDDFTDKITTLGDRVGRGLKRLFGSENERIVRAMEPVIRRINELEPWAEGLDREATRAEIARFRARIADGEAQLDDVLPEVFALVREASRRTLGLRHFDVQLVGGYVLHQGKIAEMATGEGKTLVATLPLALNALSGRKVYLVTVNDYLAQRDADWMRPIYEYLGLTVGAIQSAMDPWERKPVYAADIVYSTNNEVGFDYLRDNMKTSVEQQVQTDLYYVIVDEVDSILIDEARTPLIISGPAEEHVGRYKQADAVVRRLVRDEHYEVKEKEKSASLTEAGIQEAERLLEIESFYQPGLEDWPHYLENAIRAHELYQNDKEYVIEDVTDPRTGRVAREVVIVDEFTGRKMHGRRWSDGLHQAVEAKEGLEPKRETQTLATITFQNYFRMFEKLAGMTGTAITEAGEFHKIYTLDVVSIPTNLPIARDDAQDVVYRTEREKWRAIVEEIERVHGEGQPVLVGTASVENSEKVSRALARCWCDAYTDEHDRGQGKCPKELIPHEVLNAKNHAREAAIIAKAGEIGAVTIATNMAGRGTDIKLGGNFEYRLKEALAAAGLVEGDVEHLEEIDRIREEVRARCAADEQEVLARGGLYVLGTERHEARRIDNQLRGRSGRQGNVGESRFFLSLQDPLMRIFYRDWVTNMMERLGMTEGQAIESGMVTRAIARAQKKVEDRNFEIRKSLLEYDEVMNAQRKEIYRVRQDVLEKRGLKKKIQIMIGNVLGRQALVYLEDAQGFGEWYKRAFGAELDPAACQKATEREERERDPGPALEAAMARYDEREAEWGNELTRRVEQYLLLNAIDAKWKDHLHAIDALKAGIGLRGYGQEDPKIAYKKEGTDLFEEKLKPAIEDEVASLILRIQVARPEPPPVAAAAEGQEAPAGAVSQPAAPAGAPPEAGQLVPRGMLRGPGGAVAAGPGGAVRLSPEQVAEVRRRMQEQAARRAMRTQVPASNAFDLMRRRNPPSAAPPSPEPKEPAPTPAAYEGVGRNDPCPCGSGKKFKKCHGAS